MRTFPATLLIAAAPMLAADAPLPLLDRQPLGFEENLGQAPAEVRYVAHGRGYSLGLTAGGFEMQIGGERFRTQLIGANRKARLQPERELPGRTNYLVGSRDAWRTGIRSFERITLTQVYGGIDMVVYGSGNTMEYDLVVASGADPSQVRFSIAGEAARIDSSGDLVLRGRDVEVRWQRPFVYQDDFAGRTSIEGRFELRDDETIGFRIGAYNPALPLIIDPVLSFSTYLGGAGSELIRGTATDAAGNVYVSGGTTSRTLGSAGAAQRNYGGEAGALFPIGDAFAAKFTSSGILVYFTYIGGQGGEAASAIAVDSSGNTYLTGFTGSRDFPVTASVAQPRFGGGFGTLILEFGDAFVTKLNAAGDALVYSTFLGGTADDMGAAIAVDSAGNAYIVGATQSPNFPTTANAVQRTYSGVGGQPVFPKYGIPLLRFGDAFATKLNPAGTQIVFSTFIGGTRDDVALGVAVDSQSNVVVGGVTLSTDFPTTQGAYQSRYGGTDIMTNVFVNVGGDAFVVKLNSTASIMMYSTYFGGRGDDGITAVALDASGNAYVTGVTTTNDLPTTQGALNRSFLGPFGLAFDVDQLIGDGFVGKFTAGGQLSALTYIGGDGDDAGTAIALDPAGNVAVTGATQSRFFRLSSDAAQTTLGNTGRGGGGDAFLAVLNSDLTALRYATYLGGGNDEVGLSVAADSAGNFFVAGAVRSDNLPMSRASQGTFGGGFADAFVTRYTSLSATGPSVRAITNAASNSPSSAPGSAVPGMIFVGYGERMGPETLAFGGLDPQGKRVTSVSGVRILFDGVPAPIYYVSAGQVSGWVPYSVAGKTSVQVTIENGGQTSAPFTVPVIAANPGFFSNDFSGRGQAAALNEDGTRNGTATPAGAGTVVVLFGTGEGQTNPPGIDGQTVATPFPVPVLSGSVTVGGQSADILYFGPAPGQTAGLMQLNIRLPQGLTAGDQPVVLTVGIFRSPEGLTIRVR